MRGLSFRHNLMTLVFCGIAAAALILAWLQWINSLESVSQRALPADVREMGLGGHYQVGDLIFAIPRDERVVFYRDLSNKANKTLGDFEKVRLLLLSVPDWEVIEIGSTLDSRLVDFWCPAREQSDLTVCGKCFTASGAPLKKLPWQLSVSDADSFDIYKKEKERNQEYILISTQEKFLSAPLTLRVYVSPFIANKNDDYETRIALSRFVYVRIRFKPRQLQGLSVAAFMRDIESILRGRLSSTSLTIAHDSLGFCAPGNTNSR